ncbi:uncharacterized protein EAE97_009175 [Botrytis byssoidea]|uniref:Pal1 cell morphology protein n=1 Tax=Botrytis byssoidea TaxID=139641 RepID=A0A9P5I5D7_9HELO|nr:uncharacterized protein EAE97_009175 [Botrytis byssoidea]KAF7930966.1 hypothetical protein EAE97_009175 [Botrytis byssoidea]
MPPPASRESSRTRPSSRNSSSSGGRSANVPRNVSFDRIGAVKDFDYSGDPGHRKPVGSIPPESDYDSDVNGSWSGNDSHGRTKSRGRSRGSSGNDTDGSMGSGNVTDRRKKMHSNPDSGNRSARSHSRESRAPSQASSTRSKRAESPAPVYLFGRDDPYRSFAPESNDFSLYGEEGYDSESGRKKDESKSRKPIRPPLAPFDGEKYLPGQVSKPQAKAKRRTVEHVNVHAKEEVPILETCSDWEEERKIERKPIKKREQSQGSNSRHAEPGLSRHRSGDGENLKVKSRSEPMWQPPGGEQTRDEDRDGAWHKRGGKVRTRDPGLEANINGGLANKDAFLGLREDWLRSETHADNIPNGLVNQPESTPQPIYAINKRDPEGRKHHKGTEQNIPPDKLFDTLAGRPQEKERQRKKSPSRIFRSLFRS